MHGQTVYVDLTLITNLGADFLLLFFTAILCGSQIRWWRLLVAAGMGAVFALFFVLYPDSLWLSPLPRLLFALIMVYIAFAPFTGLDYWRAVGFFYLLSMLTGGTAYALTGLGFAPLSFKALPGALAAACVLTVIAYRWLQQRTLISRQFCRIELQQDGQKLTGTGLIDTGNALSDPITGRPVIIAGYHWINEILPPPICELTARNAWNSAEGAELLAHSEYAARFRLLPFHSVGQDDGLLLAISCEQIKIDYQQTVRIHNQVLVAIAPEGLSIDNDFQALIPAAMI
ncbi:MAG: sigma-E processing peptidase SpoIIGA [Methylocystaceae bacterium]